MNYVSNNMSMSKNGQQVPMQNNMYGSNMNGYNSYGTNGMVNNYNQTQMPLQTTPIVQQTQVQQTTTTSIVKPQDRGI